MLGGNNGNPVLPIFLDENHLQYQNQTNASNQLQGSGISPSIPNPNAVSTGLRLSYDDDDERNSTVTSGSGSMAHGPSMILSLGDNIRSELDRQKQEFDQYIKIQEEHLTKGIRDMKQKHVASFAAIEKGISKKLREKDIELETVNNKNRGLVERIKQVTAEVQNWHYRAKYNESVVNLLKSNLQQVISQGPQQVKEGFGDSEVDDAASYIDPDNFSVPLSVLQKAFPVPRRNTLFAELAKPRRYPF
ncbi:ATP binding protein [Hibiscus syriacus]|uniref:ATP binding protein n=1 Tax=Hibiscus syriacus TaxID=106335 RepID=A0A6A3D8R8_HIBSY|nr:ATP binding protein [Hibiscus syriacus]